MIQFLYGEDGMDATYVESQKIDTLRHNKEKYRDTFHLDPDEPGFGAGYMSESQAFDLAKEEPLDISAAARHALRDEFHGGAFLERCVRDIRHLLLPEESAEPAPDENVVFLWDGSARAVAGGTAYGNEDAP